MAIDLSTGETGSPAALLAKAIERRESRWAEHIKAGIGRINEFRRTHRRRNKINVPSRITPTRFYKLLHGEA